MYLSPEARAYKSAVEMLAGGAVRPIGAQRTWPVYALAVPLAIDVHWFRSRRAGDLDKRLGVLLDALQGTIYAADSQILIIHAERSEAPDGIGRVDVEITPLSPEVVA